MSSIHLPQHSQQKRIGRVIKLSCSFDAISPGPRLALLQALWRAPIPRSEPPQDPCHGSDLPSQYTPLAFCRQKALGPCSPLTSNARRHRFSPCHVCTQERLGDVPASEPRSVSFHNQPSLRQLQFVQPLREPMTNKHQATYSQIAKFSMRS